MAHTLALNMSINKDEKTMHQLAAKQYGRQAAKTV
jgi:hypothetical protein